MGKRDPILAAAVRTELAAELSRRDFIARAGGLGVGALVLGALPVVERMAKPDAARAASPSLNDATLQAFFDTIIPGKKVPDLLTQLGNAIDPKAIAGVDREHGAVYTDALLLSHNSKIGFDALAPRSSPSSRRSRCPRAAASSPSTTKGAGRLPPGLASSNPTPPGLGGRRGAPLHRLLRRRERQERDAEDGRRLRGDGPSRNRASRLQGLLLPAAHQPRPDAEGLFTVTERVDVCIVGSGLRRLDLGLAAGRALPRRRSEPQRGRPRARPRHGPHRLPPVDGRRPPLRHLRPDPGPGRSDRRGQPGRRRLQPLPRGVASGAERDLRAHRRPARRRPAPAHVAEADQPAEARPLLRPRRARPARGAHHLGPGLEVGWDLGGDAARSRLHLRPGPAGDQPGALREREVVLHGLHLRRQELADHQLPGLGRARRGRGAAAGAGEPGAASRAPRRTATSSRGTRSTRPPRDRPGRWRTSSARC